METHEKAVLMAHLSDIANGRFVPVCKKMGARTATFCSSFSYDRFHPLNVSAQALGTGLSNLLLQQGFRQAAEKEPLLEAVETRGIPLKSSEFIVSFKGNSGPQEEVNIYTSDPELPKALNQCTSSQIAFAVDKAMNVCRLSS